VRARHERERLPAISADFVFTNVCSHLARTGESVAMAASHAAEGLRRVAYFFATTMVLIVAVTFSTTSTTTM